MTGPEEINSDDLTRWLKKLIEMQWDDKTT